jgi:hypothetical protein
MRWLLLVVFLQGQFPVYAAEQEPKSLIGERELMSFAASTKINLDCGEFFLYGAIKTEEDTDRVGLVMRVDQKNTLAMAISRSKVKVVVDDHKTVPTAELFFGRYASSEHTVSGGVELKFEAEDIESITIRITKALLKRSKCLPQQ